MFNQQQFSLLKQAYGPYASWAIWEDGKGTEKNTTIITEKIDELHSKFVVLGLNISAPLTEDWSNFRGGKHDRKLKYAFNQSPVRGAYMTDLIKGEVAAQSNQLYQKLATQPLIVHQNVNFFKEEMRAIEADENTIFILLGTATSKLAQLYNNYFQPHFLYNKVVYHRHYSSRGTDKAWVESMWIALGIEANFEEIKQRYL